MHPEALELARRRVVELDVEIAADKRSLATLRARLGGGGRLARHARRHGAVAAVTLAGLAVSTAGWHFATASTPASAPAVAPGPPGSADETRSVPRGPTGASSSRAPSDGDAPSEPTPRPWEVDGAPAEREPPRVAGARAAIARMYDADRAPLMGAEQADALARRCARTRPTMARLPRETRVMDFATCSGCDCCLPEGAYPLGAPNNYDPSALALEACKACSITATLQSAGIRVERSYPQRPLHGRGGLVFAFDRPVRLFVVRVGGVSVWGGVQGSEDVPDPRALTLLAKDARGQLIDAMRAQVDHSRFKHQHDEADFWPTLVVEACPGEAIAEVEFRAERFRPDLDHIAVLHLSDDASGARGAP